MIETLQDFQMDKTKELWDKTMIYYIVFVLIC